MPELDKVLVWISKLGKMVFLFFALFPSSSIAQNTISGSEFNSDLNLLISKLEEYYPGLYYYESQEELRKRLELIYKLPEDSLNTVESYHSIAKFVSEIKDLHLGVSYPKKYFPKETKIFPLILRRFDDKFYIHFNQSKDSTINRTSEVVKINGEEPIEDFERFKNLYGADNNNPSTKNYYAEYRFPSFFTRWYGVMDSVNLTLRPHPDSALIIKNIDFVLPKVAVENTMKRYKTILRKNLEVDIVDSLTHTTKLDITTFKGPKRILGFNEGYYKRNLDAAFKKIEDKNTENLIIDLRGNGGGAVVNVHRLLSYLVSEPYNIYDSITVSKPAFKKIFKPYLGLPYLFGKLYLNKKEGNTYYRSFTGKKSKFKPSTRFHYDNNLYVLMDGGSYSATTFTISLLKNLSNATFVGTRPGGANWGSFAGQFYKLKLPNSKLLVNIPLMKLVHNTNEKVYEGFFVEPDYYVKQDFTDFVERKDTTIEFIKQMVRNERD